MMTGNSFDFDKVYDRRNTNSLKWDFAAQRCHEPAELPMWVADMDFPSPKPVKQAVSQAAERGFFGYTDILDADREILSLWYERRHGFRIPSDSIIFLPGTVMGIALAILSFTGPGDSVMVSDPVYYPFHEVVIYNDRKLIRHELSVDGTGRYYFDPESFEKLITDHNVKAYLLCSPHNPVGRVWTKEELLTIGEIALKHNVLVIADEIHADFVYENNSFVSFPSLSEAIRQNTILCTSFSKTFNTAGLQIASVMIFDRVKRNLYGKKLGAIGYSQVNITALYAMKAAYTLCDEWVDALVRYIHENILYMESFLKCNLPDLKMTHPEGTYLTWVDFSGLDLNEKALEHLIRSKAKLWLDSGAIFGEGGAGFQRFNVACPREILKNALGRLYNAIAYDSRT